MSTNREQHELAAKAAGLLLLWKTGSCKGGEVEAAFVGDQPWRPKDDDGDALRLAVKLRMSVKNTDIRASVIALPVSGLGDWIILSEPHGTNDCTATRLAIFRTAVEIGRAMP